MFFLFFTEWTKPFPGQDIFGKSFSFLKVVDTPTSAKPMYIMQCIISKTFLNVFNVCNIYTEMT